MINVDMKLESCPFCGDTDVKVHMINGRFRAGCNTLGCVGLYTSGILFRTEKDAVTYWNKKVIDEVFDDYCIECCAYGDDSHYDEERKEWIFKCDNCRMTSGAYLIQSLA